MRGSRWGEEAVGGHVGLVSHAESLTSLPQPEDQASRPLPLPKTRSALDSRPTLKLLLLAPTIPPPLPAPLAVALLNGPLLAASREEDEV